MNNEWISLACWLLWIPAAVMLTYYLITGMGDTIRRLREAAYRVSTALTLKEAMHGMTLNTLGPLYGVERQPGESNRHYQQRIMFVAAKGGKIHLHRPANVPRPATGAALDQVAKKYDITRIKGESDKHLQDRVRKAIMKRMEE